MYGYICHGCGDHLDPGEKCEQCEAKRKKQHRLFKKHYNNLFEYMEELEHEQSEI